MRSVVSWQETRSDPRDGTRATVWDVAFKPDGTQLVAAIGNRVVVYDAVDGTVLHQLRGHKDTVHCVAYSRDGKRFASGGADNTVIIWTSKAEGILKYSHNDKIQCLTYNPVTAQLTSCTATDFGMWSPEQKAVTKHRVTARVNAASWTADGQILALGQHNGTVSLRKRDGEKILDIERGGPVWCLSWTPGRGGGDVLAVGAWDGTLSFFDVAGKQRWKDRDLGFDPCSLGYYASGEYLVIGGSDGKVALYTNEGVRLGTVVERPDWVWACKPRPTGNFVAFGCNDGSVGVCQLVFSTVHGLYQERYAYRDKMTSVVVQHLLTEQSVTLKLKDYVKKIAIYKDRLAVQIPERIIVYELQGGEEYHPRQVIRQAVDCNLLVVTSRHLTLCQERRLQLLDFDGKRVREWTLEAVIRYIKVIGGPPGREGLAVGLKSGAVYKVFVDNPFPVLLVQQGLSIRCLDLSRSRKKLAVVDENSEVSVYDLATKGLLFKEPNANSVAWNTEDEDMLCYSGNGLLSIKTGTFPAASQRLTGFVVGFKGAKVFCLHYVAMQTVDIPQSASMHRYIEARDFARAHAVACLGVTDADWAHLARSALTHMEFAIARKAFTRVRALREVDLLNDIAERKRQGTTDTRVLLGDILAHHGDYLQAARAMAAGGAPERAVDMLTSLRQFNAAKEFAENYGAGDVGSMMGRQGEWAEGEGEWAEAAGMYVAAGETARAVALLASRGLYDELAALVPAMEKVRDEAELRACLVHFKGAGRTRDAEDVVRRLGDDAELLKLYIDARDWAAAFRLAESDANLDAAPIHLPYAYWLAEQDRFEEAQAAFARAGVPGKALELLESLTRNAVLESRFADAARYYFVLAMEHLTVAGRAAAGSADRAVNTARFEAHYQRGEYYFAYDIVHRHSVNPFTETQPESLFNVAAFLINSAGAGGGAAGKRGGGSPADRQPETPLGTSRAFILHALATSAASIGAHKTARTAHDRLAALRVPDAWAGRVEVEALRARARPFADADGTASTCMRCGGESPALGPTGGDACVTCGQRFQRSFAGSFEHLPVVEFVPADGIDDDLAVRLIEQEPMGPRTASGIAAPSSSAESTSRIGGSEVLTLGGGGDGGDDGAGLNDPAEDPFTALLQRYEQADGARGPLVCDRDTLVRIPSNEVYVKRWPGGVRRNEYFRNMLFGEIPITLCERCNHLFSQEDYESEVLTDRRCPFCKTVPEGGLDQ